MDDISFEDLVDIQAYTDEELKQLMEQLSDQELELSKRRRLLHGKLDILRAETERRLRDKHQGGGDLAEGLSLEDLTAALSGRASPGTAVEQEVEPSEPAAQIEPIEAPTADEAVQGIPRRFRNLSADVRHERLIRYVVKQLGQGRRMDDIMQDKEVTMHANEITRASLMQNPTVLKAIQDEMKRQFYGYSTEAESETSGPKSD